MDTAAKPVQLFALASQQARWLSVRQAVIAGNIANANTAGYRPSDVDPFAEVLARSGSGLSVTNARHIGGATGAEVGLSETEAEIPVKPSGNAVSLEEELVRAGEVRRGYELNTAIVKAFHRMVLMASKG